MKKTLGWLFALTALFALNIGFADSTPQDEKQKESEVLDEEDDHVTVVIDLSEITEDPNYLEDDE